MSEAALNTSELVCLCKDVTSPSSFIEMEGLREDCTVDVCKDGSRDWWARFKE